MSKNLNERQNVALGVTAALIEGIMLQPSLYWKNAKAQGLPFSMNPRVVYRGTAASLYNEMQMMGLQFGLTGLFQGFRGDESCLDDGIGEYISAFCGGSVAAVFASPVELVMIQQQLHGGSLITTFQNIARNHGVAVFSRGLMPAMLRDAIYVSGFLGITPVLQNHLMRKHNLSTVEAGLWASVVGGICAAVPSHPLDLVKTCMQGDLWKTKYKGVISSYKFLFSEGGLRRLFNGCFWRTFNIVGTVYIANECRMRLPIHMFGCEY